MEVSAREEEDCTLLDSMLAAQKELQRIILDNFGAKTFEGLTLHDAAEDD